MIQWPTGLVDLPRCTCCGAEGAVVASVEDHGEHVVGVEGLPLPQDPVGDSPGVGFDHPGAHVESILRVEDAHVGRLGRRGVFLRQDLVKVLDQRRL